jgi:hypothetical protein
MMKVMLDSSLNCEEGADVTVTYYNAAGTALGSIAAEITAANHNTFTYTLDAGSNVGGIGEPADLSETSFEGAVRITVTCV